MPLLLAQEVFEDVRGPGLLWFDMRLKTTSGEIPSYVLLKRARDADGKVRLSSFPPLKQQSRI